MKLEYSLQRTHKTKRRSVNVLLHDIFHNTSDRTAFLMNTTYDYSRLAAITWNDARNAGQLTKLGNK